MTENLLDLGREATAELMRHRHESTAHAIEMAIRRAYVLGRVDQSIGVAAEELRRMVEADPGITPGEVLRLYGAPADRWSNIPDWDRALWWVTEVWCEVQRRLASIDRTNESGRAWPRDPDQSVSPTGSRKSETPARMKSIPAREAAATQR